MTRPTTVSEQLAARAKAIDAQRPAADRWFEKVAPLLALIIFLALIWGGGSLLSSSTGLSLLYTIPASAVALAGLGLFHPFIGWPYGVSWLIGVIVLFMHYT
jgi:TRAP-type C4-dicarboxylate transport system permease small subunit